MTITDIIDVIGETANGSFYNNNELAAEMQRGGAAAALPKSIRIKGEVRHTGRWEERKGTDRREPAEKNGLHDVRYVDVIVTNRRHDPFGTQSLFISLKLPALRE